MDYATGVVYSFWVCCRQFFKLAALLGGDAGHAGLHRGGGWGYEGPKSGAGFGFTVELWLIRDGIRGVFHTMCTLVGFAAGLLTENLLRRSGGIAYICAVAALIATEFLRMVYYLFFNSLSSAGIWSSLFPEFLYSAILAVPCLLILSILHKRFAVRY
jgi:hypothetical protein